MTYKKRRKQIIHRSSACTISAFHLWLTVRKTRTKLYGYMMHNIIKYKKWKKTHSISFITAFVRWKSRFMANISTSLSHKFNNLEECHAEMNTLVMCRMNKTVVCYNLHFKMKYYTLYCIVLYCIALYFIALHYITLYHIILCHIISYYIILDGWQSNIDYIGRRKLYWKRRSRVQYSLSESNIIYIGRSTIQY